jgi:hypothetical protein
LEQFVKRGENFGEVSYELLIPNRLVDGTIEPCHI